MIKRWWWGTWPFMGEPFTSVAGINMEPNPTLHISGSNEYGANSLAWEFSSVCSMLCEFPLVIISCPVVAAGSSNASSRGCGARWAYPYTLFNLQFVHIENVWNSNSLACYYVVAVSKLGVVSTLEMPIWGTCLIMASRKMKIQQLDTRRTMTCFPVWLVYVHFISNYKYCIFLRRNSKRVDPMLFDIAR